MEVHLNLQTRNLSAPWAEQITARGCLQTRPLKHIDLWVLETLA